MQQLELELVFKEAESQTQRLLTLDECEEALEKSDGTTKTALLGIMKILTEAAYDLRFKLEVLVALTKEIAVLLKEALENHVEKLNEYIFKKRIANTLETLLSVEHGYNP